MNTSQSVFLALTSGTVGAVLATALGALFDRWREQARLRADVMLLAVGWADETYLRVTDLHLAKHASYRDSKPDLEDDEFRANSRQLRSLLLTASLVARVAIVFGEGEEVALLNKLRASLLTVARRLWASHQDNWDAIDRETHASMSSEVDPLRKQLERQLLEKTWLPMKWLGLMKRSLSTNGRSTIQAKDTRE